MGDRQTHLDRDIARMVESAQYSGIAISAYRQSDASHYNFNAGQLDARTPYFATSIAKLYVVAILMQLRDEGKVTFDTPFISYIADRKSCIEIHVKDAVDYTDDITIRHLMSQTSGLGDFFVFRNRARNLQHTLLKGGDTSWTFEDVIARTRSHGAIKAPGVSSKALYADSNFHILGKVIEALEQKSFSQVVQDRITRPLGLSATYIYNDPSDTRPVNLMSHTQEVIVPRSMTSFQADAGLVTTSRDGLIFLRSFFEGYLFERQHIRDLYDWKPLHPPIDYGLGVMRVDASRLVALKFRLKDPWSWGRKLPAVYGHFGFGGSFAFYAPKLKIYVAGTTNQLADPGRSIALSLRVIEAIARGEANSNESRNASKSGLAPHAAA
ncbi:serine hydrolase domain-containing protein [Pacificibacter marinus]|uniref:serine hydrolase domain-containing protein n=1 Tax=Pacificibacter marinus TaxID=658057 RepID=UPI001C070A56|nr:serine hydrolase domain-containing protein [Pacificibacter marinus]MBU2868929.1 beta-lactamase family protein [Pacificibacter marinus]